MLIKCLLSETPGHKRQTLAELPDVKPRAFLLATKDILEPAGMELTKRIFGNMTKTMMHGHKKQILAELQETMPLAFLLAAKDI